MSTLTHGTYKLVVSHEEIRRLLSHVASSCLIVGGGNIADMYLYGTIDCAIHNEQLSNLIGRGEKLGYVCKLQNSLYGIK